MRRLRHITAAIAMTFVATAALAQSFPDKPITTIVPFGAGGGADVAMRALQPLLAENLGVDIVVRNVGGAGGTIGGAEAASAKADGYVLGFLPIGPAATQPQLRDLPYDNASLAPICRVTNSPTILATRQDSGLKTLDDVRARAEGGAGAIKYASPGPGSMPHIAMLAFNDALGIETTHVPHQGGAQMIKSALGGVVDYFMAVTSAVEQNDLHAIVVLSDERLESFPDVPTMAENGHPVTSSIWYGLFAPAGTPEDVLSRLSAACDAAVNSKTYADFAKRAKVQVAYLDRPAFTAFYAKNYEEIDGILSGAGLK